MHEKNKKKSPRDFDLGAIGNGMVPASPRARGFDGIIVADEAEFAHFEACMNQPHTSTPALARGAELLRELRRR